MKRSPDHKILPLILLLAGLAACSKPPVGIADADLSPAEVSFKFPPGPLKAGAASIDVTPVKSQYLAGFGPNRKSRGVHDPVFVRAVVLEQGGERLALVSIDAIGIQRHHLPQYFDKIHKVPPDRVIIACTHDHSAPDTMGLWGKFYGGDGRDKKWIAYLQQKVGEAVDRAADDATPVQLVLGKAQTPEHGLVRNTRVKGLFDRELSVIGICPIGSTAPKAVLVNFAMHAETLWGENKIITADWPGYMRKHIESATGAAVALQFNGAQGGMITIDNLIGTDGKEVHSFAEAERVGNAAAMVAENALSQGERIANPQMVFARRIIYVPIENPLYNTFARTPLITRQFYRGNFQTEVNYIGIGPLQIITIPGEAYPKIGFDIKDKMTGCYKWVIGLANDELGYLLYPEDFFNPLFSYEKSAGMSPHWGGTLVEKNAVDLVSKFGAGAGACK